MVQRDNLFPEDVFIALKLAVLDNLKWDLELLSEEIGHSPLEILNSIERLRKGQLINESQEQINKQKLKDFLLHELHRLYPASPGKITRGMLTGAKPGMYFAVDLPYVSTWVWPNPHGSDQGYAILPLSPHCCFAALNDSKLRILLGVIESLRVAGPKAKPWAEKELTKILG